MFLFYCCKLLNCYKWSVCFYVGFPEASPRKPNPARVNQQAIPPPGQRKPHRLLLSPEGNGSQCQPAMGQPPEEGGLNPPQAQSTIISFYLCSSGACLAESTSNKSLSLLQHFINQREEFETARDGILVWLTEMDLQLTNIEHFSECDIQAKIKQLRVSLYHT